MGCARAKGFDRIHLVLEVVAQLDDRSRTGFLGASIRPRARARWSSPALRRHCGRPGGQAARRLALRIEPKVLIVQKRPESRGLSSGAPSGHLDRPSGHLDRVRLSHPSREKPGFLCHRFLLNRALPPRPHLRWKCGSALQRLEPTCRSQRRGSHHPDHSPQRREVAAGGLLPLIDYEGSPQSIERAQKESLRL
jgi:hypothetical protein